MSKREFGLGSSSGSLSDLVHDDSERQSRSNRGDLPASGNDSSLPTSPSPPTPSDCPERVQSFLEPPLASSFQSLADTGEPPANGGSFERAASDAALSALTRVFIQVTGLFRSPDSQYGTGIATLCLDTSQGDLEKALIYYYSEICCGDPPDSGSIDFELSSPDQTPSSNSDSAAASAASSSETSDSIESPDDIITMPDMRQVHHDRRRELRAVDSRLCALPPSLSGDALSMDSPSTPSPAASEPSSPLLVTVGNHGYLVRFGEHDDGEAAAATDVTRDISITPATSALPNAPPPHSILHQESVSAQLPESDQRGLIQNAVVRYVRSVQRERRKNDQKRLSDSRIRLTRTLADDPMWVSDVRESGNASEGGSGLKQRPVAASYSAGSVDVELLAQFVKKVPPPIMNDVLSGPQSGAWLVQPHLAARMGDWDRLSAMISLRFVNCLNLDGAGRSLLHYLAVSGGDKRGEIFVEGTFDDFNEPEETEESKRSALFLETIVHRILFEEETVGSGFDLQNLEGRERHVPLSDEEGEGEVEMPPSDDRKMKLVHFMNVFDENGVSALRCAVYFNNYSFVSAFLMLFQRFVVDGAAEAPRMNPYLKPLLTMAIIRRNFPLLRALCQLDSSRLVWSTPSHYPPLLFACASLDLDLVSFLLKMNSECINDVASADFLHKKSPLMFAITNGPNSLPLVKLLVEHGANINHRDQRLDVVDDLLKPGDVVGWTPLTIAIDSGNVDVASYLVGEGADWTIPIVVRDSLSAGIITAPTVLTDKSMISNRLVYPYQLAMAKVGMESVAEQLLKLMTSTGGLVLSGPKGLLSMEKDGRLLHLCVQTNELQTFKSLIRFRHFFNGDIVNINRQCYAAQRTPLMFALMHRRRAFVDVLLATHQERGGVELNLRDIFGRTAGHYAKIYLPATYSIMKDLSSFDESIEDCFGLTCRNLCARANVIQVGAFSSSKVQKAVFPCSGEMLNHVPSVNHWERYRVEKRYKIIKKLPERPSATSNEATDAVTEGENPSIAEEFINLAFAKEEFSHQSGETNDSYDVTPMDAVFSAKQFLNLRRRLPDFRMSLSEKSFHIPKWFSLFRNRTVLAYEKMKNNRMWTMLHFAGNGSPFCTKESGAGLSLHDSLLKKVNLANQLALELLICHDWGVFHGFLRPFNVLQEGNSGAFIRLTCFGYELLMKHMKRSDLFLPNEIRKHLEESVASEAVVPLTAKSDVYSYCQNILFLLFTCLTRQEDLGLVDLQYPNVLNDLIPLLLSGLEDDVALRPTIHALFKVTRRTLYATTRFVVDELKNKRKGAVEAGCSGRIRMLYDEMIEIMELEGSKLRSEANDRVKALYEYSWRKAVIWEKYSSWEDLVLGSVEVEDPTDQYMPEFLQLSTDTSNIRRCANALQKFHENPKSLVHFSDVSTLSSIFVEKSFDFFLNENDAKLNDSNFQRISVLLNELFSVSFGENEENRRLIAISLDFLRMLCCSELFVKYLLCFSPEILGRIQIFAVCSNFSKERSRICRIYYNLIKFGSFDAIHYCFHSFRFNTFFKKMFLVQKNGKSYGKPDFYSIESTFALFSVLSMNSSLFLHHSDIIETNESDSDQTTDQFIDFYDIVISILSQIVNSPLFNGFQCSEIPPNRISSVVSTVFTSILHLCCMNYGLKDRLATEWAKRESEEKGRKEWRDLIMDCCEVHSVEGRVAVAFAAMWFRHRRFLSVKKRFGVTGPYDA